MTLRIPNKNEDFLQCETGRRLTKGIISILVLEFGYLDIARET